MPWRVSFRRARPMFVNILATRPVFVTIEAPCSDFRAMRSLVGTFVDEIHPSARPARFKRRRIIATCRQTPLQGPGLMQEIYHDAWNTYIVRCAHGPTYHETVLCGAVFPWQHQQYGLVEFFPSNGPHPRQFTALVNYTPMEADIYRIWCITTHTRPAFNAPEYMVGRVVPDPVVPTVPLPRQNLAKIRRALHAKPKKGNETPREVPERVRIGGPLLAKTSMGYAVGAP